jgi:hypothetical protein
MLIIDSQSPDKLDRATRLGRIFGKSGIFDEYCLNIECWSVQAESKESGMTDKTKQAVLHMDEASAQKGEQRTVSAERRAALAKLGLAVGAAYIAPTLLKLDRPARAQGPSCAKNPKFCL